MTDSRPTEIEFPNPLLHLHERAEADLQPYGPMQIVLNYAEPQVEYAALRKGAALLDLPQRGLLRLEGKDRLSFLNNLLTNKTWDKASKSGLAAGQGCYAFLLNAKGRILADMNVLERGDHTLIDTDIRLAATLEAELKRYQFGEKVSFVSQVGTLHTLGVHGPLAATLLNESADPPCPPIGELQPLASQEARLFGVPVVVWRDDPCGVPGFQLIVESSRAAELWNALLQRSEAEAPGKRRLHRAGWAAFNAARIEAGRPIFDIDFGNSANPELSVVPAETGQMDRAVSLVKGCYVGQEIVARMHARQQVARKLAGLQFDDDHLPMAGAGVQDDQSNVVGVVTSSTVSPVLSGKAIALAMVRKPFFEPGATLQVPAEGALRRATVVAPPFLR